MSPYVPPFPNLTFNTIFTAALSYDHFNDSESCTSHIIAVFAVTSTSFYNSSLQANVVSRVRINHQSIALVELFVPAPSATTSNSLSTIQMTPVLSLSKSPYSEILINTLKKSTYFSRSLKHLTVQFRKPNSLLPALENLVALEFLDLSIYCDNSTAICQEFSVIARLPSLVILKLDFRWNSKCAGSEYFDFLGDLENNNGFRNLTVDFDYETSSKKFQSNLARLCAKNLLTHLSLVRYFTDDDLDVLIDAKLTNLKSLELRGNAEVTSGKIADAIIACSSSLTTVHVSCISDEGLIKCAEYFGKLIELRLSSSFVNGSFLREKGSCFATRLEVLNLSSSRLSDRHLGDGLKYLTSLRKLDSSANGDFVAVSSLPHLAAATSLEELNVNFANRVILETLGKFTHLQWLHVWEVGDGVESDDVVHLKNLVNLRKLTFACSNASVYTGILKIAESFPELECINLGQDPSRKANKAKFSREEVTHLLEKCWPLVRRIQVEFDDVDTALPYLRSRFPHVSFGNRELH